MTANIGMSKGNSLINHDNIYQLHTKLMTKKSRGEKLKPTNRDMMYTHVQQI